VAHFPFFCLFFVFIASFAASAWLQILDRRRAWGVLAGSVCWLFGVLVPYLLLLSLNLVPSCSYLSVVLIENNPFLPLGGQCLLPIPWEGKLWLTLDSFISGFLLFVFGSKYASSCIVYIYGWFGA
jgi:hypothetical protein